MNRISLLFIGLFVTITSIGQVTIRRAAVAPEIDGYPDDVWEIANTNTIEKPFKNETPTVTATWQALFDGENFYVFVCVEDDNHWPGWEAKGDSWLYDKVEIYWDVNKQLYDGKGAKDAGSGHYQFAEGFAEGMYDTLITKAPEGVNPCGAFAYSLSGEGYYYEMAFPYANLKDASGEPFSYSYERNLGFDVAIIDQDEGITTTPQRCVWSNDGNGFNGSDDESWNNMDGAGRIIIYWGIDEGDYIDVLTDSIMLSSKSGSNAFVTIFSTEPWSAVSDQPWLTVSKTYLSGIPSLHITATENNSKTRIAKVTISAEGFNLKYITVTQLGSGEVGISATNIKQLQLYPNPAIDKFTIQGGADKVQLFNSHGVLVKETVVEGKIVSVSELPNGVYIIKAYKNGQFEGVAKIIKN